MTPPQPHRLGWLGLPGKSTGKHVGTLRNQPNQSCWMAVGPAREAFVKIEREIQRLLKEWKIPMDVHMMMYMVGRMEDSSELYFLLSTEDRKIGRDVKKRVEGNNLTVLIRDYPENQKKQKKKPKEGGYHEIRRSKN